MTSRHSRACKSCADLQAHTKSDTGRKAAPSSSQQYVTNQRPKYQGVKPHASGIAAQVSGASGKAAPPVIKSAVRVVSKQQQPVPATAEVQNSNCCCRLSCLYCDSCSFQMSSLQSDTLQCRMWKPKHLTTRLTVLRRHTLASMQNQTSACAALDKHVSTTNTLLDEHPKLVDCVVLSTALVAMAHVWQCADTFGVTASEVTATTACKLVGLFVSHQQQANNQAVCNVFWSLARLDILPANILERYEAALATMFLATQHECNLQGISSTLWAMGTCSINPLNGRMLESLLHRVTVCLRDPRLVASRETQVH